MENLVMAGDFWKNKRVLITGHTGFKGSWLAIWLQCKGANVTGLSLDPPSKPNLFEIAHVRDGINSEYYVDIRNLEKLHAAFIECQPEIVFHMAAQALVRRSYEAPIETFTTNIMGTVNVLEAVRLSDSVRVVVNITSDKCYENKEWYWGYRENEPMGGQDPYSCSKGCAELVTAAYRSSFFSKDGDVIPDVRVATTRAGNVIGGGDWGADRLIPDIIQAFLNHRPVMIRHPYAIRPWQHVLEPLCGYQILAEKLFQEGKEFARSWNFGPNEEGAKPVSWIADHLKNLWGPDASWELGSAPQPHEATYLKLDCSKARNLLGWAPKIDIETALEWTVEWYRAYQHGENMRRVTENQIAHYESLGRG